MAFVRFRVSIVFTGSGEYGVRVTVVLPLVFVPKPRLNGICVGPFISVTVEVLTTAGSMVSVSITSLKLNRIVALVPTPVAPLKGATDVRVGVVVFVAATG